MELNGRPFNHVTFFRFLKMLELIVQEPDSSFKKLIPSIIEFSLQQMMPILRKVCSL